jgi:hypothetical protein
MFSTGILANRNNWLDKPIREQLDIPVWLLRIMVVLEGVIIVILLPQFDDLSSIFLEAFLICVIGMFCLDISLCLLELFQSYWNYQSKFTNNMSKSAYTVYLIHPLIVTPLTGLFIVIYNDLYANSNERLLFNDSDSKLCSTTTLIGPYKGSVVLAIGFITVIIVANIILWPLSKSIRQLPYLDKIL